MVLGENGRWEIPATVGADLTKWTIPSKVSASVNAGGAAVVAWSDIDHGNGIVSVAYRDAGDSAWSIEEDLSFVDGQASSPAAGIDRRGDALVVWDASVDVEGATRSAGGTWERPNVVGAEPGPPLLAVGEDGDAIAAWTTGETGAIKSASRSQAAPLWKPLGEVAPASQGLVDIELNSAGDALAMWAGGQPTFGAWVAGMDGAGPSFNKVRVPSSGYAGQRLLFAAHAVDTWSSTQELAWGFGDGPARAETSLHTPTKHRERIG